MSLLHAILCAVSIHDPDRWVQMTPCRKVATCKCCRKPLARDTHDMYEESTGFRSYRRRCRECDYASPERDDWDYRDAGD